MALPYLLGNQEDARFHVLMLTFYTVSEVCTLRWWFRKGEPEVKGRVQ